MITKIIGVGGMGINFINYMIKEKIKKVEYITIDTNLKNSESSLANQKIFLDTGIAKCSRKKLHFNVMDNFMNF